MTFRRTAALAAIGVLSLSCRGRPFGGSAGPGATGGPSVGEIDLSRGMSEEPQRSLFGTPRGRGFTDLALALADLPGKDKDKGVLVKIGAARMPLARSSEVARQLDRIKKAGIPVVCHADDLDNGAAMLVASCSKVWLSPAGGVETVGIAAQLMFANKLLKKLHVDVDFLQIGKYKGAEEPFTRDEPSPEARESLEGTLKGLRAAWLAGFELRPSVKPAVVEDGPYGAKEAKELGLVDELGSYDQAKEALKTEVGATKVANRFGQPAPAQSPAEELIELFREASGAKQKATPHVAVVVASGAITVSSSRGLLDSGGGIAERDLGPVLAKLAKNDAVKAVVLRLDSPGGSALASDLLWLKLKDLQGKKPLVTSVGGMAASGGYYLASASTKIVAERASILGSIGVVTGKFGLAKALDEFGVHVETVAANPEKAARAGYQSPFVAWDDGTRGRVRKSAESIYDLFLERVAAGRGMSIEAVKKSAEGRIYGGAEAKDRGMVDQLGGVLDAIALARELAGVPADTPAVAIGAEPTLADIFEAADAASPVPVPEALETLAVRRALRSMPEVATSLAALSPLIQGERFVVVAPFALVIR